MVCAVSPSMTAESGLGIRKHFQRSREPSGASPAIALLGAAEVLSRLQPGGLPVSATPRQKRAARLCHSKMEYAVRWASALPFLDLKLCGAPKVAGVGAERYLLL